MCCGVTIGLALEKLSGSLNMSGLNDMIRNKVVIIMASRRESLWEWYGWNGILSISEFVPSGLLEPSVWRSMMWIEDKEMIVNGKMK